MNKLFCTLFLFVATIGFSQEGGRVEGNTVTTRETAPVWPGCEGSEKEKEACFDKKLVEHISKNYQFPRDANGDFIRGKTTVTFNVNREGKVEILSVKGTKTALNKEAARIVLSLPKMKPGELAGKPIPVKYTIPFTF